MTDPLNQVLAALPPIPPNGAEAPWHGPEDNAPPWEPVEERQGAAGATKARSTVELRRWTMPELLDADRSFSWLVRGLMVRGTYGMIGGERKSLKSYIGSFIDVAVAAGVPVFGRFAVDRAGPVVTYVGEGGRVPYTRRLERIAASMGVDLRSVPLFPLFETASVQSVAFQSTLARDLDEIRPELVSLDPLYAYHGAGTNAANLFEEGALLNALSEPCLAAGAVLRVATHFNKTGTGRGLDRLTMAGAQEWCDSWWLVSHRESPDVANGEFRLLFEVGSRQWGGSTWDLDLSIGRFNEDEGEFDGAISWHIARHEEAPPAGGEEAILDVLRDHPWELTRTQVLEKVGGNRGKMHTSFRRLETDRRVRSEHVTRAEGNRRKTRSLWATADQLLPEEVRVGTGCEPAR